MPKYDKLTSEYRLHFKNLRKEKPVLDFHGKNVTWKDMLDNVKTLSEPVSTVNHEKLSMRRGLAMRYVKDGAKGKSRAWCKPQEVFGSYRAWGCGPH